MADTLRLFVAIELPEAVTKHIGHIIATLRQQKLQGIRWISPQGVHLTLKFLGEIPESQSQPIVAAMQVAATGISPFVLQLQGIGIFPHLRAPRILWVGVKGNTVPLFQVCKRLEVAMEEHGFARNQRELTPHLTLARVNGRLLLPELQKLSHAMNELQEVAEAEFQVTALSLMESQLSKSGAIYRQKARIPLCTALASSFGS